MLHKLMLAGMVSGLVASMLFFTGCRRDNGRHPDPEKIVAEISSRLDLDEDQSARLREMVLDLEAEIVALHDAQPDLRSLIPEMIRGDQLDGAELQDLYTAKRESVDLVAEQVIASVVEFHTLLTPEQRETLATKMENHHEHKRCRFFNR